MIVPNNAQTALHKCLHTRKNTRDKKKLQGTSLSLLHPIYYAFWCPSLIGDIRLIFLDYDIWGLYSILMCGKLGGRQRT